MAQDYNIYIHSNEGTGSNLRKTTIPFANQESVDDNAFQTVQKGIKEAEEIATNGFGGIINTGVAKLGKAFPIVAGVVMAGVVTDKVMTTGFGHLESYTGNFEYAMGYNNFKAAVGRALNPIGTYFKAKHIQAEANKQNDAIMKQNRLFGLTQTKIGV